MNPAELVIWAAAVAIGACFVAMAAVLLLAVVGTAIDAWRDR